MAGLSISLGLFYLPQASGPVLFQSLESKSLNEGPVYNNIKFLQQDDKDIWIMQQGHQGLDVENKKWDRLALVVEKSKKPYQAKFYQLSPGDLKFASENEIIANKARCFACHASGPRLIRPSPEFQLSPTDKMKIFAWNLRIKSYPKMHIVPGKVFNNGVPFRSRHSYYRQPLSLASCTSCHASDGLRAELTQEHAETAAFLVEKGAMPPFPFRISDEDLAELKRLAPVLK